MVTFTRSTSSTSVLSWLRRLFGKSSRPQRGNWRGGVKLVGHKSLSNQTPIQRLNAGKMPPLSVPLRGRNPPEACVEVGQRVRKGEVIAWGEGEDVVWVHAPTSGIITALETAPVADLGVIDSVQITPDGLDEWGERQPLGRVVNSAELADFALRMGLVGLGGAGFPTGLKLQGPAEEIDTLLINGAECEPFITCDDRLMRERAGEIVAAADYLAAVFKVERVCIGVEPNKPEALARLRRAATAAGSRLEVCALPHRYPAGGQPLLVKSLSGRHLPPGHLPAEVGAMVLNVATVYALGRAVFQGEPLISRVVTLTGNVKHAGNVEVPIGLPVAYLLQMAGVRPDSRGVQVGGPMMGRLLEHDDAVVSKTTNCLIARSEQLFSPRPDATPCIRCNRCIDVCPMALQPLHLFAAAKQNDVRRLQQERLSACIECGACSHVCPSHLPLRDSFRQAKRKLRGRR